MQAILDILNGDISVSDILAMSETETPESETLSDDELTAYAVRLWEISMASRESD